MTDQTDSQTVSPAMTERAIASREARLARESDALRRNLLRRKAQARGRRPAEADGTDLPDGSAVG